MADPAQQMRAVRFHTYGDPSVLQVDEVPRPEPKPGEVLIRVRAAGVNPIDWKYRAGFLKAFVPLKLPSVPGLDVAGTVVEVGEGVTGFSPGDEVLGRGNGTYAEYATAPAGAIAPKPAGMSFEEAATLPVGGVTAWVGLFDVARLELGQFLLVQGGAGGVGSLAVQLGHDKGAHVAATTSTANVEFVASLGADQVVDYTADKLDEVVSGVDVVLDTVGGAVTAGSWGLLRPDGILVTIAGMPDAARAAQHGVRVSGARAPEVTRPILDQLVALVAAGRLTPQVGRVFPLAEAGAAQALSESGHGRGRIVLEVS